MGSKHSHFKKRTMSTLAVLTAFLYAVFSTPSASAFSSRNLSYGCVGYSVYELENRLKFLGYYHGPINGIFTWTVYWAVRDFQYAFGMTPTGYVNLPTKQQLVRATQAWHYVGPLPNGLEETANGQIVPDSTTGTAIHASAAATAAPSSTSVIPYAPVNGISPADISLMAHVVYAEARGEPLSGQVGVADVILNRLKEPNKFPNSIPGIIYQPGAFQSVSNGTINEQPNTEAMEAVLDAIHGWDPVGNALYYFNPATSTSSWIWSKPEITQIGNQIFSQ
ncbi:spore cortex-lytic enzyme [Alicyclobacillus sp. SP_1]|uniref:spore cortex-lytic enzyme n=1 Tax=Alicyclobacillus sp. SP_1 TaxID=2942475 RepID=UPI002157A221|nr:spore cortex-lytic enzyme [Alicyclobacillus sp. SP_1]